MIQPFLLSFFLINLFHTLQIKNLSFVFVPYFCPAQLYMNLLLISYSSTLDNLLLIFHPHPYSLKLPPPIFSSCRVFQALSLLQTGKAYNSDGITPRVMKEYASELALILACLFCFCKTLDFSFLLEACLGWCNPSQKRCSNPSNYCPLRSFMLSPN